MRIALVVLFLLFEAGVFAESPRQPIQPINIKSDKISTQIQRGTEQFPFIVKTIQHSKTKEESDKEADERDDRKALNNFTRMLVVVGLLQFVVLFFQVYFLCKTLKATQQAAEAAEKSASYISKVERAYVFVGATVGDKKLLNGEFTHHDPATDIVYLSMSAVIKNHGKTPAILSKIYGGWIVDSIAPTKSSINAMIEEKIPTGIILSADREPYLLEVGDPAQTERFYVAFYKWQQIISREKTFFLYGRIEYKDILGADRNTGFCWQYCPDIEAPSFTIANSDLNYCDENNDGA